MEWNAAEIFTQFSQIIVAGFMEILQSPCHVHNSVIKQWSRQNLQRHFRAQFLYDSFIWTFANLVFVFIIHSIIFEFCILTPQVNKSTYLLSCAVPRSLRFILSQKNYEQLHPLFPASDFLNFCPLLESPTGGSVVKNLPAIQEPQKMWVQPLGWEGPLEKQMATPSSILAWKISWTEKPSGLQWGHKELDKTEWLSTQTLLTKYRFLSILWFNHVIIVICGKHDQDISYQQAIFIISQQKYFLPIKV